MKTSIYEEQEKYKISLEKNFSSYERYARLIAENFKVSIKVEGSGFHTDGKKITIPQLSEISNYDSLMGVVLHECSHIKWTDMKYYEKIPSIVFFSYMNAIEDIRIERKCEKVFDGAKGVLNKTHDEIKEANKLIEENDSSLDDFRKRSTLFEIDYIYWMRGYSDVEPADSELFSIVHPIVVDGGFPKTTAEVFEKTKRIMSEIKSVIFKNEDIQDDIQFKSTCNCKNNIKEIKEIFNDFKNNDEDYKALMSELTELSAQYKERLNALNAKIGNAKIEYKKLKEEVQEDLEMQRNVLHSNLQNLYNQILGHNADTD